KSIAKGNSSGSVRRTSVADSIKRARSDLYCLRAEKARSGQKWPLAEEYVDKAIEQYPQNLHAWYLKAHLENQQSAGQKALKALLRCQEIDSSFAPLYLLRGQVLLGMKRKNEAFTALSKAIDLDPENVQALMARAGLQTEVKKNDSAIADYSRVLK